MEKNTYNIFHPVYSTQLYNISRTAIDWTYILKDVRVIELLDTAPKDLREQTIELFYKTMIGISLYFQSKKDKDLETIKMHYPNLPTILKQMIKEGVERGELYAMEYMYSINNYPSEYDNNSATYKAATADIVMELEKLGDDTAQPAESRGEHLNYELIAQNSELIAHFRELITQTKDALIAQQETTRQRLARKEQDTPQPAESKDITHPLPDEFKTETAKKIFARGVEAGYFEQRGEGFESKVSKEELAWFAYQFNIRILGKTKDKRGKEVKRNQFIWNIFHRAFSVDKLPQWFNKIKQYDKMKANIKFQNITKLFD